MYIRSLGLTHVIAENRRVQVQKDKGYQSL